MTRSTWAPIAVVSIITMMVAVAAVVPAHSTDKAPHACATGNRAVYMRERDIPTARVEGDTVTITPTDTGMVRVRPDSQWFDEAVTEPNEAPDGGVLCAPVSKTYRLKIAVPVPVVPHHITTLI